MEFKLTPPVTESKLKISYQDKILLIGSCFSEEIGNKMKELKFDVMQNPNGILYDPVSICSALNSYLENKKYGADDIFLLNELWHSWDHHSAFSGPDKESVLENINHSQKTAFHFLKSATWIIITPGTAFNYCIKETGKPVANCHKAPSGLFEKKLIPLEEIISKLSNILSELESFNPKLRILFTVSPVRHIRDGLIENNRSKARLIEAVHYLTEKFQNAFYFPAYELVIDVLRDYRFYKDDLVHPSDAATNYVFENFCNAFIDERERKLLEEIQRIKIAQKHKPFHKETNAYKKFAETQFEKIRSIENRYPFIDFTEEKNFFQNNI